MVWMAEEAWVSAIHLCSQVNAYVIGNYVDISLLPCILKLKLQSWNLLSDMSRLYIKEVLHIFM